MFAIAAIVPCKLRAKPEALKFSPQRGTLFAHMQTSCQLHTRPFIKIFAPGSGGALIVHFLAPGSGGALIVHFLAPGTHEHGSKIFSIA
jgi:hypothetical protein